ncbi:MAG: redoxin domain-containing protein [Candidatus Eisenbacteria bacterium]
MNGTRIVGIVAPHARAALLRAALAVLLALLFAATYAPRAYADAASTQPVPAPDDDADSVTELLGQPARAWTFERWVDSPPLTLAGLRGKVVLVRWFNTNCRFCGNTLPGLESLRTRYAAQGLVVVGVFHPKPVRKVSDAFVRRTARKLGFHGPLAVDEEWTTLNRWWLANHPDRNWTSVSFLIDRDGIVRWAQGGGEYHPSGDPRHARCDASYAELERTIRRLTGDTSAAR